MRGNIKGVINCTKTLEPCSRFQTPGLKRADRSWYRHIQANLGELPDRVENFVATSILGIELEQELTLFEVLETLRLTGVAFRPFDKEFSHCFNMVLLSRLQLSNCPASLELFGTLIGEGIILKLKSFELSID
jgi:hypothetical protein